MTGFVERPDKQQISEHMLWDFNHASYIPSYSYILTKLGCYRKYRYKSMLRKATKGIAKELDLIKFI